MNLRQLEIFIAIVEEGSLTKAADRVHIVQPALTHQIKVLEEHFGVPLLIRSSKGVTPTEAGLRLVTHARSLLAQFAALRANVAGLDGPPSGEVRVGMPANASPILSPRLISALAAMYPEVRVHIVEPMMGVITQWLAQTKVDIAISYRTAHPRSIETEKILTETISLCCAPNAPEAQGSLARQGIPLAQACALPLIVPHRGYSVREILEAQAQALGLKLNVSIEIDSHGPTKSLVEQGLGYAFLPSMAIGGERGEGKLVCRRVVAPQLERAVYIAWSNERQLTPAVLAVRAACRAIIVDLVREGLWEARLENSA